MEYLDVYDENKKKTGKIIVRGEKPKENEHILLSIIFIKNSEGKYLIQKTSKYSIVNPLFFLYYTTI